MYPSIDRIEIKKAGIGFSGGVSSLTRDSLPYLRDNLDSECDHEGRIT